MLFLGYLLKVNRQLLPSLYLVDGVMASIHRDSLDQSVMDVDRSCSLPETDRNCENLVLSDVHAHSTGQSVCKDGVNLSGEFYSQ